LRLAKGMERLAMSEFVIALLTFACLSAASLGGLFSYEKLPSRHREDDTQSVVH
jgi:hypothetical protein